MSTAAVSVTLLALQMRSLLLCSRQLLQHELAAAALAAVAAEEEAQASAHLWTSAAQPVRLERLLLCGAP